MDVQATHAVLVLKGSKIFCSSRFSRGRNSRDAEVGNRHARDGVCPGEETEKILIHGATFCV